MKIFISILFSLSLTAGAQIKRKPVPKLPPPPTEMVPMSDTQLSRIDPHGSKDQKPTVTMAREMKECSTCHGNNGDKLTTLPKAAESCATCHNAGPHSGIVEHQKHKVTCNSCHTFHRAEAISYIPASGKFQDLKEKLSADGLKLKSTDRAMLKKNCTDCHNKW